MPAGIELVLGLGGGKALDASKFVALDRDAELILAPTILSSGAIIHGNVAKWDGYQIVGGVDDWPWVDCEYVLVDVEAVLRCTPSDVAGCRQAVIACDGSVGRSVPSAPYVWNIGMG